MFNYFKTYNKSIGEGEDFGTDFEGGEGDDFGGLDEGVGEEPEIPEAAEDIELLDVHS